jgi:hypothetical protein
VRSPTILIVFTSSPLSMSVRYEGRLSPSLVRLSIVAGGVPVSPISTISAN